MKYNDKNNPIVCMQTNSTCYKGTQPMKVLGVLWHSTGANNPTLKRYVQPTDGCADYDKMISLIGKNKYGNDWNHVDRQAGLNAWIGQLADGTVAAVQTMPWDYRPWGCGKGTKGSCNDGWIQFEICEDDLTSKEYFDKVYKEAVELTAYLCKMYKLDPKGTVEFNGVKVPVILCHSDSYKLKLGSNHSDVYSWFNKFGKTMDDVRSAVADLLKPQDAPIVDCTDYLLRLNSSNVSIYDGPGSHHKVVGSITNKGTYTIVAESGSWGKLKSGAGWIKLSEGTRKDSSQKVESTQSAPTPTPKKSVQEIANEVWQGKWGTGRDRKNRLEAAGYNYEEVQKYVNKIAAGEKVTAPGATPSKKSVEEIAKEVWQGKWGNGAERKKRLTKAGYNYDAVQAAIKKLYY